MDLEEEVTRPLCTPMTKKNKRKTTNLSVTHQTVDNAGAGVRRSRGMMSTVQNGSRRRRLLLLLHHLTDTIVGSPEMATTLTASRRRL